MTDLDEFIEQTAALIGQTQADIAQGRHRLAQDALRLQSLGIDTQSLKDQVADRISDADRLRFEWVQAADFALDAPPARPLRRKLPRPLV